ncbi:MAG TPA: ABC transporter substrate-binding protein [Micromonosporaceae bacterium]|nr:ABC transporter substrate-binding protein [Micromonosporaceae bacterium]
MATGRGRPLVALAAGLLATILMSTACAARPDAQAATSRLRIGLLVSLTGIYKSTGEDMRRGAELYLSTHGNALGGHPIELIAADEGDGGLVGLPPAEKLVEQDRVAALVGVVNGGTVTAITEVLRKAEIPLLGSNGRPSRMDDVEYVWHTSYVSADAGAAMGAYVRRAARGPVYVIGPDYPGGWDEIGGFVRAFAAAGGKLANPGGKAKFTPYPSTTNFQPYLDAIESSDARAVYCSYTGRAAIDFVMQYKQYGLAGRMPLYAAGFLTEGNVLTAQGAAATGIKNSLNYAADLDNPTNRAFVAAYQSAYNMLPTTFAMSTYDAMAVLDRAIAAAGEDPTPESINEAIGAVGQIDSPRGVWHFNPKTHTPVQKWYLRDVRMDGPTLTNVVLQELPTIGG